MLTGSGQKARSRLLHCTLGAHGHTRLPVWKAGANSFMSLQLNMVNPTSRLRVEAGASARNAVGVAGRGCWKKRRPLCNGADRDCNITPPRKRADFQRVVRDERTRRTFTGGNQQMNAEQSACASSGKANTWEQIDWPNVNARSAGCKRVSSRQLRKAAGAR